MIGGKTMKKLNNLHAQRKALVCCASRVVVSGLAPRSCRDRLRAFLRSGEEGQSLVELALTLPIMLMIMTGIFAFGIIFYNQLTLGSAVDTGGRYLQSIALTTTDPCADTFTAITQAAPTLNPAKIGLTIVLNATNSTTAAATTKTGTTCSGAQSNFVLLSPATVTATYPCSIPIYGYTSTGTCQLTSSTTENIY
jgi:Flp pilus assembly protein TadG